MADDVVRALAEARALGFLGPGPLEAHEASAQAFIDALGPSIGERALDLGSGGGVPGLLLAAHYGDVGWVLLDVHRRRTSFLARVVAELGWGGRVTVVRAAAEEAAHDDAHRERYDLVTSRSFGPPATTAECATGFLALGGRLAVAEPPEGDRAGRWPVAGLATLGLEPVGEPGPVAVFRRSALIDAAIPRPWRQLEKAPRWS
jgi:16S rRNA (guanine527-N7)-methyltransferase